MDQFPYSQALLYTHVLYISDTGDWERGFNSVLQEMVTTNHTTTNINLLVSLNLTTT